MTRYTAPFLAPGFRAPNPLLTAAPWAVCAAALFTPGSPALAQESATPVAPFAASSAQQALPPPAWRTQLELGFNGARGNSSFVVLRTGMSIKHLRTDVAEFDLSGLYRYGKSDGEVIARDWRSSLKFDLYPENTVSPFVFATASGDALRRLDVRSEGGGGAKYTFWRGESGAASVSAAALYSYENYSQEPGLALVPSQRSARWSFRTKGEKRLGDTVFQQTTFYRPVWNRSADYFVEATTTISTRLVGDLNLAIEHEYLRDASPPPDVEKGDHKLSVLFRYVL